MGQIVPSCIAVAMAGEQTLSPVVAVATVQEPTDTRNAAVTTGGGPTVEEDIVAAKTPEAGGGAPPPGSGR